PRSHPGRGAVGARRRWGRLLATRDRPPARPRYLRAAHRGEVRSNPPRPSGHAAGARDPARVPGARGGPPGRADRDDRRPDRPGPPSPDRAFGQDRPPPRGPDALRNRAPPAPDDAASPAARDRPYAPDPRAPGGHPPSGLRRPPVRRRAVRRSPWAYAPISAQHPSGV